MPTIPPPTRFPVRVWLISLAGWMFDFYDLVLFSFLLVPIGQDLGLTHAQETTLLGVALGGSGFGGILFGYLSDRFGRRHVMTWTILVYSVGTGLTGFATGFWSVLGFRLLTGLGVGGEWAVGHALLAESTPQAMRGRASALLQAGEPMGVGLAAVMGFLVAPVIGWRMVFFVSARRPRSSRSSCAPSSRSPRCGRASATSGSRRCRPWRCWCGGAWSA